MTEGFILKNWLTQWGWDFKPEIYKAGSLQDSNSNRNGELLQSDQQGINFQNTQKQLMQLSIKENYSIKN